MERLDLRAIKRISGPAWQPLRSHFERIHAALIGVSPTAAGELTTVYIKYTTPGMAPKPFAVVWVKKSTEIVVGLSLPEDRIPPELSSPPAGCKYAGLTGYFKVAQIDIVPQKLDKWAKLAYEYATNQKLTA